jgi:hypothetical protein
MQPDSPLKVVVMVVSRRELLTCGGYHEITFEDRTNAYGLNLEAKLVAMPPRTRSMVLLVAVTTPNDGTL